MKDIKLILNIQLFAEGADGNEAQSAKCKTQSEGEATLPNIISFARGKIRIK